ncbi:MAG TPA: ABC transporter permease subunit [Myxococcota bacterium]|nr:ABC transporter permease subunit [Myxococcota bacterium]
MSELWPIIKTSLLIASLATLLVMLCSTLLALLLVTYRSFFLRMLELLIYVPMAMPPVALGFGLLQVLGPNTSIGSFMHEYFNIDIAFTPLGAVVAAFMVSFGIGLRAMRISLENIDPIHGQRAALMGANKLQVFYYITFPLCRSSFVGAAILVFIRSLGEFGATMVLAGNNLGTTRTLALAIWTDMQNPSEYSQCLMLVMISAILSLLALLCSELLLTRNK